MKKFRQIKGELKSDCDECGKVKKLSFYDKQGNYVCGSCKTDLD